MAALGFGLAAGVAGGQGGLDASLRLLALAALADGLSGVAARRPGASTGLGAELDSLAALVAFGVALPLSAFASALEPLGWPGWALAGALALATALRLSRDNAATPDKPFYQGVPPAGPALVIAAALAFQASPYAVAGLALASAGLMLGPQRYPRLGLPLPWLALPGFGLVGAALGFRPAWLLVGVLAGAYVLAGPVLAVKAKPAAAAKR